MFYPKQPPYAILLLLVCAMPCTGAENTQAAQWLHLKTALPAHWQSQSPSSSMRLAQYRVPGHDNSQEAAFVIYYFGVGQGGSATANIARWQSQFSTTAGGPVEPQVKSYQAGGLSITQARLEGNYARGVGVGPQGTSLTDHTLLAAVVEFDQNRIILQLYGPSSVVNNEAENFESVLKGFKTEGTGDS